MIKRLLIIPDDVIIYISNVQSLDIKENIKDFLIDSLVDDNMKSHPFYDFYLDYPYKYNFFDFSQRHFIDYQLEVNKKGFTQKELNLFTWEYNFINKRENKHIKLKLKNNEYYKYLERLENYKAYEVFDKFIITDRKIVTAPDELVKDPDFVKRFVDEIFSYSREGLWVNSFNNYSIRYDKDSDDVFVYDPDTFFIFKEDEALQHIKTEVDFVAAYKRYKINPKDIIYRLKYSTLTKEAAEFLYYSYWFNNTISDHIMKYH